MKSIVVTGSSGLIGSEVAEYFGRSLGYVVHGVDNNQRAVFFGPQGDNRWNQARLQRELPGFTHHELDIRDRSGVASLVQRLRPTAIVHAAAQPSHDRAAAIPFDDSSSILRAIFKCNVLGTFCEPFKRPAVRRCLDKCVGGQVIVDPAADIQPVCPILKRVATSKEQPV